MLGAERGAMFLVQENLDGYEIKLRASRNLTQEEVAHPSFQSSMRIIEQVIGTGKSSIRKAEPPKDSKTHFCEYIRSCICVPMMLRDKVTGVLYYDNRLLGSAFKEEDFQILAYFAGQAALAVDNLIGHENAKRLNDKLKAQYQDSPNRRFQSTGSDEIIGDSLALKRVLFQVNEVANTDIAVSITGETGVGKDLLAQLIHRKSRRNNNPFIIVNCATLPEDLVLSELFGHEMGAYTGATHRRTGRFELADGGTLFLDEVGELPMEIQASLLRVLENNSFERVGGNEKIKSDFRLIVATNCDLEKAVKENKFRADLFYRISGFPIFVPPLRERFEDVRLLSNHFLHVFATKNNKHFNNISDTEMKRLMSYHWPGNIRELKNVIEWGSTLSTPPIFRLPEAFRGKSDFKQKTRHDITLRDNESRHILFVLERTGWRVRGRGGASELLDVHPSTLESRMKKLGIIRPNSLRRNRMFDKD